MTGCSDRPIELVREGAGFPIKLWDVDAHGDCFVQARRKDGLHAYYQIADPSLSGICLLVCAQIERASA